MLKKHVWLIAGSLVIGLVLGRVSAPAADTAGIGADGKRDGDRSGRSSGRDSSQAPEARSRIGKLQQELRQSSTDKVAGILYRALDCPDPNERSLLGFQCIEAMDASNWQLCLAQFAANTRDTGRENKTLWEQCLFRAGQVGGEESMEFFKKAGLQGKETESWTALYGWATGNPAAASKWLAGLQSSDPAQYNRLLPAIAAGSALTNPEEGIRLMNSLPEAERKNCVGHFTWNLVQNGGIDQAVAWMKEVTTESGGTPTEYSKAVINEVMRKIVWSATNTGSPKELAARLEQLEPVIKLDEGRLQQAVGAFQGAVGGLNLLAELSDGPVLKEQASAPNSLPQAISAAVRRDPEMLVEWIRTNPSVPFLESAAIQACQQFQGRGMTSEVEKVLQALPDGVMKENVKASLQN